MSPAQQSPDFEPTTRSHTHPRTRYRRQPKTAEPKAPLSHLRLRCTGGAAAASSAYLAVLTTTVVRPSALTLKQIIGLEFALGIMATLCAVVAIVLWVLTENTAFALSVFKAASVSVAANAALETELRGAPDTNAPPIPIQRGQEIRRHRKNQHAV